MGKYVNSTLAPDEKILCSGHYNGIFWVKRIFVCLWFIGMGIWADYLIKEIDFMLVTSIVVVLCVMFLIISLLNYLNNEMVITNQRVVFKTGVLAREIFEMNIQKIETVAVIQSVMGRSLNYGFIQCRGTGGTRSKRIEIDDPLAFRAAFQKASKVQNVAKPEPQKEEFMPAAEYRAERIIFLLSEINAKLDRLTKDNNNPNGSL